MHKSTIGIIALASTLTFTFSAFTAEPANAQGTTVHWNTKEHERSQNLHSAGISCLLKGKIPQAQAMFRQATNFNPKDPAPFASLGLSLAMEQKYTEAMDALQKAFALSPTTETLLSIGIVYYLDHDYDAAVASWQKVLEKNPKLCHIYGDMGFAFIRKGNFDESEKLFQTLVKCYPNSQFGYHGIALSRYLKGDFVGARKAAEQAESIVSYPPVILLLAKLDYLQGDRSRGDKRVSQFNSVYRKKWQHRSMTAIGYPIQHDFHWDPFLADCFDNGYLLSARLQAIPKDASRQRSLARQGKATLAIAKAKKGLENAPKDFYLLRELGLAQLANGEYSNAVESFRAVIENCPSCNVDLLHLGRALSLDGKSTEASAIVREYQRKFPAQPLSPALAEIGRVDPALQSRETVAPSQPQEAVSETVQQRTPPPQQPQGEPAKPPAVPASEF